MSMKNYGGHGHVAKAETLENLLPNAIAKAEYRELLEQGDWEAAHEFLQANLPKEFPCPESCFLLNDECECDENMELNVVYAYWDTEQLFETKPRPELYALRNSNVWPEVSNWVTFG